LVDLGVYNLLDNKLGKELMTMDELAVMDSGKCILQLRGVRPFFSDKFDITKHKHYRFLGDHNKKNNFDIEKYMETNLRFRKGESIELMEFDLQ
jgi:type IV secretion system protein VirD4